MTSRSFIRMTLLGAAFAAPVAARCQTPPTYIGIAHGSSNSASGPVTINVPPGTKNGDLMLAYIATQTPDGAWITAPAGWTKATKTFNSSQGSQLFWRVANNEPKAYTWSGTSYPQGVNATAPIASTAGCTSAGGVSCQIPAIHETSVAGELYVGFWDFSDITEAIYGPADLVNNHYNQVQRSMISGDKALKVVGSTAVPAETATVRGAANHWDGIAVTVSPASSSSPSCPLLTAAGGGSFQDKSGNTWSLTSAGVITENGAAVPGGDGTAQITYVPASAPNIWGQDAGSGAWYEWQNSSWTPGTLPSCGSSAPPPPPPTGAKAISANDFLNSLGFNIGPGRTSSQSAYQTMINYLGVRVIRGSNVNGNNASWAIPIAQATNTKWIYLLESGPVETQSSLTSIEAVEAKKLAAAGVLLALEGANETDNWYVTWNGAQGGGCGVLPQLSWLPVAQLQAAWYTTAKADSVLKNYPMYTSSHAGGEVDNVGVQFLTIPTGAGTLMPDGTKYGDFANMHNYVIWNGAAGMIDNAAWNAASPTNIQEGSVGWYQLQGDFGHTWCGAGFNGYTAAQLPSLPRVTTETGWGSQYGGDDNQGKVLVNVFLAQFKRGYVHTFIYQRKDNEGGFTNTFGVFDTNNNPKLGATYIHNLTSILNDNVSVSSTPGALPYAIPSEPATVHDLLLQKSTGQYELVVWDERPIGEAADNVTVNLGGSHSTVKVYDVTVGTTAVKTYSNVSAVPLTLTDHPMILEVIN
jgi:hypothetical protein